MYVCIYICNVCMYVMLGRRCQRNRDNVVACRSDQKCTCTKCVGWVVAAWCALNPLALLFIPLEMVSQPDGIGSKPLAIENSQVKRLHRPLWWFALPGGGWRGGRWGAQRRLDRSHGHVREQLVAHCSCSAWTAVLASRPAGACGCCRLPCTEASSRRSYGGSE